MTDLSPAAQEIYDAAHTADSMPAASLADAIAAALRAAALCCVRERRILMSIADELEGN